MRSASPAALRAVPASRPSCWAKPGILPLGRPAALPQLLDERGLLRAPLPRPALGLGQLLAPYGQLGQLGGGLVDGGLHLQQAGRPGRPAVREVGGEHVPLPGHRGQPGVRGDQFLGVLQCRDDHRVRDEAADGPDQRGGPAHEVGDGGRGGGERDALGTAMATGPGLRTARRTALRGELGGGTLLPRPLFAALPRHGHRLPAQQHRRAPRVPSAQQPDRVGGGGRVRDGHRVRRRAEGGRDRDLEPGLDGQQFGGGPEEPGQPVPGAEQRTRAVLAAEPEGQCLVPGRYRRPPALGGRGLVAGRAVGGLGLGQGPLGLLVAGGQFLVDAVQSFDLGLELLVLLLGGDRALLGLVTGGRQPVDLGLGRTGPAAGRVDLAVQPGEPFAPVGDGAGRVLEPALLGGQLAFQVGAVGDGVLQRVFGRLQGRRQLRLLFADPGRLALQVLGIAAAALLGGRLGGAADPGVGERDRAADPLGELGELVPGLLGALEPGREPAHLALQFGLAEEGRFSSASAASLRFFSSASSAISSRSPSRRVTRSSARSRSRASRRSAWMTAARRATAACRPSGLSWRRSSSVRSWTRARLAPIASSFRSAFSFRLRCLRTPAASSMKARRPIGSACSTESNWPCPTMTCISRPIPESERSSWMSSSRQVSPLIWYSLPPLRNMIRVIVTSAYSMGNAPSELSIVSETSARPSGGRPVVPAKITSSDLRRRAEISAPCVPMTQESASTTLRFSGSIGSDDAGDPRFEPQGGGGRERFETTQGQGLEVHAAGLYLSLSVSLMKVQGTSDGKRRGAGPGMAVGQRKRDAEASL
ncbi:hypothetical protein SBADM41S_08833 [Streptomyces badius]